MQTFELQCDDLQITVSRKSVKNLNLRIRGDDAAISLSIPKAYPQSRICAFIRSKRDRIMEKRQKILASVEQRQHRSTLPNKNIYHYLGKPYVLKTVENDREAQETNQIIIKFQDDAILLRLPCELDLAGQQSIVQEWLKHQMSVLLEPMIEQWEKRMGVVVTHCSIRQMKTRWGSCTPATGRIRMNLELIKRPKTCIEFVLVHELVHFFEGSHNKRFYALMDKHLPDWREREQLLKQPISFVR